MIDSHCHFWKYSKEEHDWITDDIVELQKDRLPEHLKDIDTTPELQGVVAVQAPQTLKETEFLLNLADRNDFIKAVVGWVDICSDTLEQRLEHYSGFDSLKGFRYILQTEQPGFMSRPTFVKGLQLLHKYGYTYDLLVDEHQLSETITLVCQLPEDMPLVIDHIGKPNIKKHSFNHWKKEMQRLAQFDNVHVKLSGMVTEADWTSWKQDDFVPYINEVLELFGPQKLLYGSDWPMCTLAATYQETLNVVLNFVIKLSKNETEQIMHRNTVQFYRIT